MTPNPILKKLGLADSDRVVIIHADDIGMYQAGLAAFSDLVDFGLVSSGAAMVPCPWFPQTAAYCRENPQVDMGVHLTLNSEWDSCRWGPISTRDAASGLLDSEGYFHRRVPQVEEQAALTAVRAELQAQIERAVAAGIIPTHTDAHMGTAIQPKFITTYLELTLHYKLPGLFFRLDEAGWQRWGLDGETAVLAAQSSRQVEEAGMPLFDHLFMMPLDRPEDRVAQAKQAFANLPPGLSYFLLHPAKDSPELRSMAHDWSNRVADYQAFCSQELADFVKASGIQVIGWRPLRELMREA